MSQNGFTIEFKFKGTHYLAYILHFEDLTDEQLEKYKIKYNTFYVVLFSPNGFKSFELFLSEDPLIWETDISPIIIDPKIIQLIGDRIDSLAM